jgi:hypothetical protein
MIQTMCGGAFGGEPDVEAWWTAVETNLREDALRLVSAEWSADDLLAELGRRGASATATGIVGQLAGQTVPLGHAVHTVFATGYGDLISLVPGRLAYYDGGVEERSLRARRLIFRPPEGSVRAHLTGRRIRTGADREHSISTAWPPGG